MCGIVAYRGRERAVEFLTGALQRLEYRGYDSAGVAVTAAELDSRGARVIRVGSGSSDTFPVLSGPPPAWGPLESVLAFQHLARCLAVVLGRDADKPRNLAKSVTVL